MKFTSSICHRTYWRSWGEFPYKDNKEAFEAKRMDGIYVYYDQNIIEALILSGFGVEFKDHTANKFHYFPYEDGEYILTMIRKIPRCRTLCNDKIKNTIKCNDKCNEGIVVAKTKCLW